jgi:hypothetical protein
MPSAAAISASLRQFAPIACATLSVAARYAQSLSDGVVQSPSAAAGAQPQCPESEVETA